MDDVTVESTRGDYLVSTDRSRLDIKAIHNYLAASYWSPGLPMDVLVKAIAGSLCFGLYQGSEQIAFARVITDRATFAYLCDVFVLEAYRGEGLGQWLMQAVAGHPALQGLRRFVLVTRDAHGLYEKFGFRSLARPEGYMEIHVSNAYLKGEAESR